MRLLAAGQRPISNVVDASNYVMLELGKPIHTFDAARGPRRPRSSSAARARASASRPSTTSCASSTRRRSLIADPTGPLGIAGVMGGAASEVGRGDHRRRRRVGHLRPDQHPPDGASATPSDPRPACASRRARSSASRGSAPTGRPCSSPSGRAARSPRARSISNPDEPRAGPRRLPAGAGQPAARHGLRRPTSSAALLARVGIETAPAGRRDPGPHRRGHEPARHRARRRRGGRRDRPDAGGATWRSRPTSRRRSSASAATTSSRPPCRTRRCRPTATTRSRCATPSARPSPAPACPRS